MNLQQYIMRVIQIVIYAFLALASAQASATLLTFEGFGGNTIIGDENTGNGLAIGTSNGFEFTSSGDHFHFGSGLSGVPSNGTGIMLADRSYTITMTQTGGGAFSFLSGDFGEDVSFGSSATTIVVTGFLSGGGTTVQNILLDGNSALFQNAAISGMSSVASVTFQGIGSGSAANTSNGFTFDNLNVGAVPEPATLALMCLGLAGIGFARKQKAA